MLIILDKKKFFLRSIFEASRASASAPLTVQTVQETVA